MILFGGLIGLLTLIKPKKTKQENIKNDSKNQIISKDGDENASNLA